MLIHAQTMKYVLQMPCNCVNFQFRSKLTLLYSHMALLCMCRSEVQGPPFHNPGLIRQGQHGVLPARHAASSVE